MAPKQQTGQFSNMAILSVTESAANTLTFKKLETGISLNQKVGWIISAVEYFLAFSSTMFNGDGDNVSYGLSVNNAFATPSLQENTILDFNSLSRQDFGTAANAIMLKLPFEKDFSTLPGGGILVPPTPLYGWCKGNGLVSAQTLVARIHYTTLELSIDQYWELVESMRPLSS